MAMRPSLDTMQQTIPEKSKFREYVSKILDCSLITINKYVYQDVDLSLHMHLYNITASYEHAWTDECRQRVLICWQFCLAVQYHQTSSA